MSETQNIRIKELPEVKSSFDGFWFLIWLWILSSAILRPITNCMDNQLEFKKEKFAYEKTVDLRKIRCVDELTQALMMSKEELENNVTGN